MICVVSYLVVLSLACTHEWTENSCYRLSLISQWCAQPKYSFLNCYLLYSNYILLKCTIRVMLSTYKGRDVLTKNTGIKLVFLSLFFGCNGSVTRMSVFQMHVLKNVFTKGIWVIWQQNMNDAVCPKCIYTTLTHTILTVLF